jgi:ionotropic kainate glutamate receptor 2/glutamate receptor delta-1 subunit
MCVGGCYLPDAQSGRFFIGFYWMSCIVIVATYSGNLIAFLTVTKDVLPFSSFEEMVNQHDYKYGVLSGTALTNYLQVT